jgi:hypothetical protein
MASGRTASAPAAIRPNTKSLAQEIELRPMTVPSDVAPGGSVGRLTSGSRRPRPGLLASRLPDPDRRMTSCPHGGATCSAMRDVRPADLLPLLRLRRAG